MSRRQQGWILEARCEPFYLNSDVESDEERHDGHTEQMIEFWKDHFNPDRFDNLFELHVFELKPKLVSPVRQGKL